MKRNLETTNNFFTFLCDCALCKLQALQNLQIVLLVTRPPGAIPRQKKFAEKALHEGRKALAETVTMLEDALEE